MSLNISPTIDIWVQLMLTSWIFLNESILDDVRHNIVDIFGTLFIPSFYYQMTPKIPLNTRCSISISKNLSINGRTRSSDQLGIWSYNINP